MDKGRILEKIVLDPKETEGMNKEERRAYYIRKFRLAELARLQGEVFE
jgi:hypothetical protein